jgi:hypothetical protein
MGVAGHAVAVTAPGAPGFRALLAKVVYREITVESAGPTGVRILAAREQAPNHYGDGKYANNRQRNFQYFPHNGNWGKRLKRQRGSVRFFPNGRRPTKNT